MQHFSCNKCDFQYVKNIHEYITVEIVALCILDSLMSHISGLVFVEYTKLLQKNSASIINLKQKYDTGV